MEINTLKEFKNQFESFIEQQKQDKYSKIGYLESFLLGYYFCLYRNNQKSKEFWSNLINIDDLITNKLIDENQKEEIYCQILNNPDQVNDIIEKSIKNNFGEEEEYEEQKIDPVQDFQQYDHEQQELVTSNISDSENIEWARKLIQEEESTQEKRRQIKEQNDYKDAICQICLNELELDQDLEPWGLQNCGHVFHKVCLNNYFIHQLNERQFPINCPEHKCNSTITLVDIEEICDNDEDVDKFINYSFQAYCESHNDEVSNCPTPDCKYVFLPGNPDFTCPLCKKRYCMRCQTEYHVNETCEQYRIRK